MGEYCVYCNQKIDKASKEHVIQNALGGKLETTNICCGTCNAKIGQYIDAPFVAIFNPFIGEITDISKTNKRKSIPSCDGKAYYKDTEKIYNVKIKGYSVSDCRELKKEKEINFNNFTILWKEFSLDNKIFKNGLGKIAFNFALYHGIEAEKINSKLNIVRDNEEQILDVCFDYPIIPFYPLNPFDEYFETKVEMVIYHHLLLFSQGNILWCYINLFNTFQFYVLLSDTWDEKNAIFKSYAQEIHKYQPPTDEEVNKELDNRIRRISKLKYHSVSDIYADARYYNVEPTLDMGSFKNSIIEKIRKESKNKIEKKKKKDKRLYEIIPNQISDFLNYISGYIIDTDISVYEKIAAHNAMSLYFDQNDNFMEHFFRAFTFSESGDMVSYPIAINEHIKHRLIDVRTYTTLKFEILNRYLYELHQASKKANYSKETDS